MDGTPARDDLSLDRRVKLPEALRVLLHRYPRAGWPGDPGYDALIRFWLDRHLMFRRLLEKLGTDARACLDGTLAPKSHAAGLARYGGLFVTEIHGHHRIESAHYFPVLAKLEPSIAAGFDLLDRDHDDLDAGCDRFVAAANAVLQAPLGEIDTLHRLIDGVAAFERVLDRHLIDEEELVVPVLLKHGSAELA